MEGQTLVEGLRQEEDLALKQVCLDRHLPEIASKVERWDVLQLHNIELNAFFKKQFTAVNLGNDEQLQFKFLKLWKHALQSKATYCKLCENFRSTQNVKAENFTRRLSVSSLKEIIREIINSNHDFFISELHVDKLIELMRKRGLVTDNDVEIIKDISTEQKRCKYILSILRRSSFTCFQKFVILLSESSIHGDIVAKVLEDLKINEVDNFLPSLKSNNTSEVSDKVTSSRKRKREDDNEKDLMTQLSKHFRPSELSIHFNELLDKMIDCLQRCEVPRLITKFNVLMADHAVKIPFFPQELLHKLYECETVEDLLLKLSPYISWQRMHILQLVVEASNCVEAKELLSNFKSEINETLSIKQYRLPPPSKRIVPAQDSPEALISTKCATDDMTLQDANKISKALADSTGTNEHCFELTSMTTGSIILYWLVIRSVIELVIEGVYSNRSVFYSMGIVEVCIDPGIVITTLPSVRVGSLSYLTGPPTEIEKLSSTITKLNLDLLANFKPLLASEQSDFKLKVEDLQAKCHTLGHKATGDIMSLKEKVKHLEESNKRADEVAKQKLSQIQSDHDDVKSKLSVLETENLSLKSKNKNLVTHISATKEQAREKEIELKTVRESSETVLKEIAALKEEKERREHLEGSKKEEAEMKLSQIQSDHDETESKLSMIKTENLTLKSDNKNLITHVFTAKEQARQKESQLQKANETIEELMKEITSLKQEKMSGEKKTDTPVIHSLDPEKYTSEWRCSLITGVGNIHFGRPDALAIGPNLELLICDYKHQCVFVLDSELNLLNTLGTTGDGRLTHPNGIAVDQDGTIAISDYRFHQVKKFSLADGKCICSIGEPGQEDGNFDYPRGLAFSSDGLLYVMDWGNSRIQVFNKQNEFEFKFGTRGLGPSEFDHPTRIALDGSDNVYVANYNSSTIGIFDSHGKFMASIPTNKPFAIAVTSTGYIFADDNDKNLINMWNPKHQLIGRFGQEGDQKGEFNSITDMAIGKSGLYVVDGRNKRLQLIEGIDW